MFSPFKLEIVGKTLLILMNVVQIQDQAENNMLFLTIAKIVEVTEKLAWFLLLFASVFVYLRVFERCLCSFWSVIPQTVENGG